MQSKIKRVQHNNLQLRPIILDTFLNFCCSFSVVVLNFFFLLFPQRIRRRDVMRYYAEWWCCWASKQNINIIDWKLSMLCVVQYNEILSSILCTIYILNRKLITKYKLHTYRRWNKMKNFFSLRFLLAPRRSFVFASTYKFYAHCAGLTVWPSSQQVELAYVLSMHNVSETLSSQRRQNRRRTPIVFLSVAQNPRTKEEEFILNSLVIMSRVLRDMECFILYFSLFSALCRRWCSV